MKKFIIIPFITILISCSTGPVEEVQQKEPPKPATLEVEEPEMNHQGNLDSMVNIVDSLGRKTGKWETKVNGEIWKTEFYEQGKLHGLQTQKLNNGEILETRYIKGLKHGISQQYSEGDKVAKSITIYHNGKRVFSTFPQELSNGNFKKAVLSTELDSIELKLKYLSGKKLYQGKIIKESSIKGVPGGQHKVFYENGKTKFLLDYDIDSMYSYDKKGKPVDTLYFSLEKKIWPKLDEVEINSLTQ